MPAHTNALGMQAIAPPHTCVPLPSGLKALLAEDEPLIALDLDALLHDLGIERVVVVSSVAQGLRVTATEAVDFALLDVRLGHEPCFPLAVHLEAAGVPFAFVSGYPLSIIPPEFSHVPMLSKPYVRESVRAVVARLVTRR
jgi:CheY-like chemotaxis protein